MTDCKSVSANACQSHDPASDDQNEPKSEPGASSVLLPNSDSPPSSSTRTLQAMGGRPAPYHRRVLCDTWYCEVLAIIVSSLSLIAIGVVLRVYEGRASPQLSHGLTLNAIISILATLSKSCLIYAVASSISQLKWCWFQKETRQLPDLQGFDDASRGPLGSMTVLFTRAGWSLISVGAFVTVLATVFDPFVQQLLNYPSNRSQGCLLMPPHSRLLFSTLQ